MAKAIHIMIRVLDEARSVDFYAKRLRPRASPTGLLSTASRWSICAMPERRFRGRADRQSRPHRALCAWRRLWPSRGLGRRSRGRTRPHARALGINPENINEFNREGVAASRASSSSRTPTATRSRFCREHGRYRNRRTTRQAVQPAAVPATAPGGTNKAGRHLCVHVDRRDSTAFAARLLKGSGAARRR